VTQERRRGERRRRPLTRPILVDLSTDESSMRQLMRRVLNTGRFAQVRCVGRTFRAAPLRFKVWAVLCWPKEEKIEVEEA